MFPLRNWDEAWYAEIIKNMAVNKTSFLMSFWNGRYYFDKPPFYYWLTYPIIKFFGLGELQVRIVSLISFIVSLVLIYLTGKKLFNKKIAILATISFLTFGQVIERFSKGNLDALMIVLTLTSFYTYINSNNKTKLYLLTGIFSGLTALTKGLATAFYPLTLIFVYQIFTKKKINPKAILIPITTLLIFSIWLIASYLKFGSMVISSFLVNLFAGNINQTGYFSMTFFLVLVRDIGFWLVPVFLCILKYHKEIKNTKIVFLFLCSSLFIIPLFFFRDKLGWHLLPTYPLISLIVGYSMQKLITDKLLLVCFFIILSFIQIGHLNKKDGSFEKSLSDAKLGLYVKTIIPRQDVIILDDSDFPTFLYYSDHGVITVISEKGGRKDEWWVKSYKDKNLFENQTRQVWLISAHPEKLNIPHRENRMILEYLNYKIIKI